MGLHCILRHNSNSICAGSLSGAAISACVQPLDVIRTRMQADATLNALSGALGTFRKIVAQDGFRCTISPFPHY